MRRSLNWRRSAATVLAAFIAYPGSAAFLQLVSQRDISQPPASSGGGGSVLPVISPDGRYVLFASTANNLVVLSNGVPMPLISPASLNVFLHDRTNTTTVLVSVNLAGTGGGNGDSLPVGVSTNGCSVLFESAASDLVANDTNNASDVFVRDLVNGATLLVSVNTNGQSGNDASRGSIMTPDGRYVAFASAASDLVPGDTNSVPDVFVRDLQANATTLVSTGATPAITGPLAGGSESPEITPDGRYVVFYSAAVNLVPGVTTSGETYVRDLVAGKTIWASTNARAIFQSVTGSSNAVSCNYSISTNGQFVAFEACTNATVGYRWRGVILRYNVATGLTDVIHTDAHVPLNNFEYIHDLDMSPDGRFVAFVANIGDDSGTNTGIYLWDAQTGMNALVSANGSNSGTASGNCDFPVVTADGQYVAFLSSATNLTSNPLTGDFHLYLRDMHLATTTLLDVDTNGAGSGVESMAVPGMSADSCSVAFASAGANFVPNDRNDNDDVYVRNLTSQTTELISARAPALPSITSFGGPTALTPFSVNANGRYVAFTSQAQYLTSADINSPRDVFVRDLMNGANVLVSVNTNGNASGDGISTEPAISGDGRYAVFTSSANDLVLQDSNNASDVFIRDLQNATTSLVSIGTNGIDPGNGDSFSPVISTDGRYVLFHSKASNLASGSAAKGIDNVFVRDLQARTTYALTSITSGSGGSVASMTPDGHYVAFMAPMGSSGTQLSVWSSQLTGLIYSNGLSGSMGTTPMVSISPDGKTLAYITGSPAVNLSAVDLLSGANWTIASNRLFFSHNQMQFSGNGLLVYAMALSIGQKQNIYLYDFQARTNQLITQNPDTLAPANGDSEFPAISADGRFVAYSSAATDLVEGGAGNGIPNLFVYDRLNNSTALLSASITGIAGSGNNRSLTPVFSGDGRVLVFASWASDLTANDFNQSSDLFAFAFFYADITIASGGEPTISWPNVPGQAFHVEYKDDLNASSWTEAGGTVTINGNRASLSDPAPSSGQRFYRVVAE